MDRRIVEHKNGVEFLAWCQDWLKLREIENHGLLSLASVLTPTHPIYDPPFIFAHVDTAKGIEGCCIYAEPDGLIVSDMPDHATIALFDYLQGAIHAPSRIFGPEKPALRLATLFSDLRRIEHRIHSAWRTHYLADLNDISIRTKAGIRLGRSCDEDLISRWGRDYDDERPANVDIQQFLLKKLADRQVYLLVDEVPKCLATVSGENCSGPRISSVYTPPLLRSKGYATAMVYGLSRKYLESGRPYVTLSTQTGDPVEQIYRKLGFVPVTEKLSITLRESVGGADSPD